MPVTRKEVFEQGDVIDHYPCDLGGSNNAVEHVVDYFGCQYLVQTTWDDELINPDGLVEPVEED